MLLFVVSAPLRVTSSTFNDTDWESKIGKAGFQLYDQLMPFYDDLPDMAEVFDLDLHNRVKQDGFGKIGDILKSGHDVFLNVSTALTLKLFKTVQQTHGTFEGILEASLDSPVTNMISNVLFKGRMPVTIGNVYHFATAIFCYYMFVTRYQEVPITPNDVIAFK